MTDVWFPALPVWVVVDPEKAEVRLTIDRTRDARRRFGADEIQSIIDYLMATARREFLGRSIVRTSEEYQVPPDSFDARTVHAVLAAAARSWSILNPKVAIEVSTTETDLAPAPTLGWRSG